MAKRKVERPFRAFGALEFVALIAVFAIAFHYSHNLVLSGLAATFAWLIVVLAYSGVACWKGWEQPHSRHLLDGFFWP